MPNETCSAEWVIVISYPTSVGGIIIVAIGIYDNCNHALSVRIWYYFILQKRFLSVMFVRRGIIAVKPIKTHEIQYSTAPIFNNNRIKI